MIKSGFNMGMTVVVDAGGKGPATYCSNLRQKEACLNKNVRSIEVDINCL